MEEGGIHQESWRNIPQVLHNDYHVDLAPLTILSAARMSKSRTLHCRIPGPAHRETRTPRYQQPSTIPQLYREWPSWGCRGPKSRTIPWTIVKQGHRSPTREHPPSHWIMIMPTGPFGESPLSLCLRHSTLRNSWQSWMAAEESASHSRRTSNRCHTLRDHHSKTAWTPSRATSLA